MPRSPSLGSTIPFANLPIGYFNDAVTGRYVVATGTHLLGRIKIYWRKPDRPTLRELAIDSSQSRTELANLRH